MILEHNIETWSQQHTFWRRRTHSGRGQTRVRLYRNNKSRYVRKQRII